MKKPLKPDDNLLLILSILAAVAFLFGTSTDRNNTSSLASKTFLTAFY